MIARDPEYRRKRCTKFFFCLLLGALIHTVLLLTILQGILHIRYPKARISEVTIPHLYVNFSSSPSQTTKLVTQVTLHNPTFATFWFHNGSLAFLYRKTEIGLGFIEGVNVKGRSIKMLNTITILNSNMAAKPDFRDFDDINSGVLPLTGHLKLDGEMQLLKVIRRKAIVETGCVMVVNLVLQDIGSMECK